MVTPLADIPHLLHDAHLLQLEWIDELGLLKLYFSCLRRNTDGSSLEEPVELQLAGVSALAAYYSPVDACLAPSRFEVTTPLQKHDLVQWSKPRREIEFHIDSAHEALNVQTACRVDWLVGSPSDVEDCRHRVCVRYEDAATGGRTEVGILVPCESIDAFSGGLPLELDEWRAQFDAWWLGWREYWARQYDEDENAESAREATFIPAGESAPPDLSYRPPDARPVLVGPTDLPADLLAPLVDLHEGHHGRDWLRMARAWPWLDQSPQQRAAQLQNQYESHEFGRWVYLRHVDSWWQAGSRACVVARGIEHCMPDEDDPASNRETVISYGLREHERCWIIWTWSQGWPGYGSAPELEASQDWREGWDLSSPGT